MPPVFTSAQLTHGNLPPHPSQLLPDTAGEQVMPGPQASSPAGTHAPASRADPRLAPQNHLAQLLGVTTAPTVPSSVLHMVPLLCWLSCWHSSSRHPSVSHLSSCTASQFLVFPQLVAVCHGIPHSSSQLPQVTHTRPHTTPHTVPLIIHHDSSQHPDTVLHKPHAHVPHVPHTISHTSPHISSAPQSPHDSSQFCTQFPHTPHTFLHSPPPRPLRSSRHCPTLLPAV